MKRFAVERVEVLFNRGELDRVEEFVTEDFVNHEAWPGEDPGYEGFRLRLRRLHEAIPDIHLEVEDVIAEGDTVAYRATLSGTHRGELMGMAPTGPRLPRAAHALAEDARRTVLGALGRPRRPRDAPAARDHPGAGGAAPAPGDPARRPRGAGRDRPSSSSGLAARRSRRSARSSIRIWGTVYRPVSSTRSCGPGCRCAAKSTSSYATPFLRQKALRPHAVGAGVAGEDADSWVSHHAKIVAHGGPAARPAVRGAAMIEHGDLRHRGRRAPHHPLLGGRRGAGALHARARPGRRPSPRARGAPPRASAAASSRGCSRLRDDPRGAGRPGHRARGLGARRPRRPLGGRAPPPGGGLRARDRDARDARGGAVRGGVAPAVPGTLACSPARPRRPARRGSTPWCWDARRSCSW